MSEATGPAMPNLGSSLVPQQNPETVVIGPTPPMKDSQRMELERYMKRDAIFLSTFEHQRQRQNALMNEKQLEIRQTAQAGIEIFGPGYSPSYGNGSSIPLINGVPANNAFRIVYPAQRRRARKSKEFSFTKTMVEEQAQKEDVLVPIRLDIELDGLVLRDTFTWNLYESHITPEHFAEVLCEDLQFPVHQFAPHVAKAIRDQIQDYHLPALSVEEPILEDQDQVVAIEEAKSAQELRILIKIDITVANTSLIDQFEWDISCPNNDPEHFADVLAAELGLGGEFRTAIAHSIREQVQTHTKCLNLIGYNYDGSTVHDEDLKSSFLPKISTILREEDAVEQFTPILEKLTEPEIDKLERDRERDKRLASYVRILPGWPEDTTSPPDDAEAERIRNLPKSLVQDQARLHQLYPSDRFDILVRANGVSGEVSASMEDYRVRCLECPPGKLYNSGPEGTLQNFEVHLKSNRAHRSYVEQKKQRAGGTMPSYSIMPHAALQQPSQHPMPPSPLNPQQQNQQHHMAHHQQPQRMNGVGLGIEG
ncbi:SWI/SNF chromatin-remodeling complex subunit [Mortierella polycephala]|uniref:SWI/SNF chromatin-remodeling complex subunit n=1 Tax=Mortierella polycephala TaxID=41804 RepID=A0A9P6PNZ6_9FUNG|nr:SWI/SNF chromatin-remodeling complex subunit [Mortierella polycephala]